MNIPRYRDLLTRDDAPPGSAWRVFGQEDELGTLNFIGADEIRRAASLVVDGKCFNLDCPLELAALLERFIEGPVSTARAKAAS